MKTEDILREDVFREIADERRRQDETWGGPHHDDQHPSHEWVRLIAARLGKADRAMGYKQYADYRRRLVQVAALAVAAIEANDRQELAVANKEWDELEKRVADEQEMRKPTLLDPLLLDGKTDAEFDLMRARKAGDYAARFLREHPGSPEAEQGWLQACEREDHCAEVLRAAEEALKRARVTRSHEEAQ